MSIGISVLRIPPLDGEGLRVGWSRERRGAVIRATGCWFKGTSVQVKKPPPPLIPPHKGEGDDKGENVVFVRVALLPILSTHRPAALPLMGRD